MQVHYLDQLFFKSYTTSHDKTQTCEQDTSNIS